MKTLNLFSLFSLMTFFSFAQDPEANVLDAKPVNVDMSVEEFMKKVSNPTKAVLVHFEAEWCALCLKLKPILKEVGEERKDKIEVLDINTDQNPKITKHFEIDGLPVMILYKNGKIVWSMQGFLSKKEILGTLDVYQ